MTRFLFAELSGHYPDGARREPDAIALPLAKDWENLRPKFAVAEENNQVEGSAELLSRRGCETKRIPAPSTAKSNILVRVP
ncbi:MAG: hypothetical protein WCF18_03845, partial [Chthoniobacteraceae bacterium]